MEPISQQPQPPPKCETCGSNKTKARVIWLNPENGEIYPKVKPSELIIVLVLMGLSLFWFITTVINHENPLLMVVSVAIFIPLTTVSVVEGQRYLSRKNYEETWFYTCQACGSQWMAPYDQGPSSYD
jgi:hypothetical protein